MSRHLVRTLAAAGLVVAAFAGTHAVSQARSVSVAAIVKTAPAHILVDAHGLTLYLYTLDKHGKSACTGVCAQYWPPVLVPAGEKVAAHLSAVDGRFGVTTRAGGKRQLTFDGAPLYTFIEDKKPGDMRGQGAVDGTWWVVVVNTTASAAPAAGASASTPAPTPTPGSGSGGNGGYGGYGDTAG